MDEFDEKTKAILQQQSGRLWSWIRKLINQGTAIQQDYQAGKYSRYEEFSARLDGAARERVDEGIAIFSNVVAVALRELAAAKDAEIAELRVNQTKKIIEVLEWALQWTAAPGDAQRAAIRAEIEKKLA